MRITFQHFARSVAILASVALVLSFSSPASHAQQQGGGTGTGGDTATGGQGAGDDPLGFDAGVTLERTERATRDTGAFIGAQAPSGGNFGDANPQIGAGGGPGGLNQLGQSFNFFNQLNRANQFNQQNQQNQIRVPLRLGFDKPPSATTHPRIARQVGSTLSVRFKTIDRFAQPINVTMQGGTAVLTGSVADAETRRLAERLAMIEPGVVTVQNELEVVPQAEPELLPTPAARP